MGKSSRVNRRRFLQGSVLMPAMALLGSSPLPSGNAWLLNCPVDKATAVRFFYNPKGDYLQGPLVFRMVPTGDSRLNTAPVLREGRTAYVTREEMKAILRALAHSGASWSISSKVEPLSDVYGLVRSSGLNDFLLIQVMCSKGTARGKFEAAKICNTLAPLDSALKTPRALWEFQALRIGYRCKVPGFNWDAYPERRP